MVKFAVASQFISFRYASLLHILSFVLNVMKMLNQFCLNLVPNPGDSFDKMRQSLPPLEILACYGLIRRHKESVGSINGIWSERNSG